MKRRAQEMTRAATMKPETLAKKRSVSREEEEEEAESGAMGFILWA